MKKTTNKKNTNKTLAAVVVALVSLIVVAVAVFEDSAKTYDESIMKNASIRTYEVGFKSFNDNPYKDGTLTFDVTRDLSNTSETDYIVKLNEEQYTARFMNASEDASYKPTDITDVSAKYEKLITSSKELIYSYIDESTILKDKEKLKESIRNTEFKEANYTDDKNIGAFFRISDATVYINKNACEETLCQWMVVHELVHALAHYTHDCNSDAKRYAFTTFNEVITDLITESLHPELPKSGASAYREVYWIMSPYINLMGEKAINAYFYNYDEIDNEIGEVELEFFVKMIENFGQPNTNVCYQAMIWKWYANIA